MYGSRGWIAVTCLRLILRMGVGFIPMRDGPGYRTTPGDGLRFITAAGFTTIIWDGCGPGYEWAPAWVTWGSYGGNYGWAPLGPGISISVGMSWRPPRSIWWTFVPCHHFGETHWGNYVVRNNTTTINHVTIINNIYQGGGRPGGRPGQWMRGPRREEVEHLSNRRIQPMTFNNVHNPGTARVQNNSIALYRPVVNRNPQGVEARPARVQALDRVRPETRLPVHNPVAGPGSRPVSGPPPESRPTRPANPHDRPLNPPPGARPPGNPPHPGQHPGNPGPDNRMQQRPGNPFPERPTSLPPQRPMNRPENRPPVMPGNRPANPNPGMPPNRPVQPPGHRMPPPERPDQPPPGRRKDG